MLFSTHERLERSSIRAPAIGQLMDAPEIETSCKSVGKGDKGDKRDAERLLVVISQSAICR